MKWQKLTPRLTQIAKSLSSLSTLQLYTQPHVRHKDKEVSRLGHWLTRASLSSLPSSPHLTREAGEQPETMMCDCWKTQKGIKGQGGR